MIRAIQGYAADLLEAINLPMKAIAPQIEIAVCIIECKFHKVNNTIEGKVEVVVAVEIKVQ
jgi:hypothetical protein